MTASADDGTTLIVAAMRDEIRPLLRAVERRVHEAPNVWRGLLGDSPVRVLCTGEGSAAATASCRAALSAHEAARVLVVGVSGAITGDLAVGDLVAAHRVIGPDGDAPPPDRVWTAALEIRTATLLGSPIVLTTAEQKRRARLTVDAPDPVAVDLETAALAGVAHERGLPFAAIRAISDTAEEDLAIDFERFRGDDGRIRRGRVALHAALRPTLWGTLLDLNRRMKLCASRLADATARAVTAG